MSDFIDLMAQHTRTNMRNNNVTEEQERQRYLIIMQAVTFPEEHLQLLVFDTNSLARMFSNVIVAALNKEPDVALKLLSVFILPQDEFDQAENLIEKHRELLTLLRQEQADMPDN